MACNATAQYRASKCHHDAHRPLCKPRHLVAGKRASAAQTAAVTFENKAFSRLVRTCSGQTDCFLHDAEFAGLAAQQGHHLGQRKGAELVLF